MQLAVSSEYHYLEIRVERTAVALFITLQADGRQCEVATGSIAFHENLNISRLSNSHPICQGISRPCVKKFPACLSRNSPPICQELSGLFVKNFPVFCQEILFNLQRNCQPRCQEIPCPFVKKLSSHLSRNFLPFINKFPVCLSIILPPFVIKFAALC